MVRWMFSEPLSGRNHLLAYELLMLHVLLWLKH